MPIVVSVLLCLVGCQPAEVDHSQQPSVTGPAATEKKAEALEQNAAAAGNKAPPSPSEMINKPEAQAVDPAGGEPLDDAITCLARTIYWEARGEATVDMEAIANVVMNRLGHEGFPNTICNVVRQGHEQGSCQFSWWCDGRSDQAKEDESYATAKEIARKALNLQLTDRTGARCISINGMGRQVGPRNTPRRSRSVSSSSTSLAGARRDSKALQALST